MKKIIFSVAFVLSALTAGAQHYYQDYRNPEMLRHASSNDPGRKEVVLPQVNGYNVYKADLHTHTVFSDGQVLPGFRVKEAWMDGLDIMAVTEHVEYRPHEATFVDYLENYIPGKKEKAENINLTGSVPTSKGIMIDLNYSVIQSQKAAESLGITIIPGCEITRNGTTVGHFNALFTTDNNTIYDPDPVKAVKNAKAQGALVLHNHPGWTRKNIDFTETEKVLYGEGLIDGVEVMNGDEFYPGIVDRTQERGLFISANSDIHTSTATEYRLTGSLRPMTLIFAHDKSLESIKEALLADRTLALGFNTVCGEEQLLKDFFNAGMKTQVVNVDSKGRSTVMLTNCTSVPYFIKVGNSNPRYLNPFSTISIRSAEGASSLKFEVLNMFSGEKEHPTVEISF